MKILFLIPPSEGKNPENLYDLEELSFAFPKPLDIAKTATVKDLKCEGKRFAEAIELNKNIEKSGTIEAISRYDGVMYSAINYAGMTEKGKDFFRNNFAIFSGMYAIVKPNDKIGNYKLPIETKGLYLHFWKTVPDKIVDLKPDFIVNLLPISYAKMIGLSTNCNRHKKKLAKILDAGIKVININFLKNNGQKISHGVKTIKGEWIKQICENQISDYRDFGGKISENGNIIDIDIIKK
ncbi:MAG: peroxide stress protein YaaA [Candidatus Gracilibacteria bacterium]|nr:peroxide stress protein YaaA [Candidatus Gracilibacteria bacterium]